MKKRSIIFITICLSATGLFAQDKNLKPERKINLSTRYECYKGDLSSPVPGECPKHHIVFMAETDPSLAALISESAIKDPKGAKEHKRLEDVIYICKKGDYKDFLPGRCPVHALDLLNNDSPEVIEMTRKEIAANPDWGKNAVRKIDHLYYCVMADYKARDAGKCPVHNIDLMLTDDPHYNEMLTKMNIKNK